MTSLAAETRTAVRRHPFLYEALRAGVVNYAGAARFLAAELDDADVEPIIAALRRYGDDLQEFEMEDRGVRVTMQSRLGETTSSTDALFEIGDVAYAPDEGTLTGVMATGDVDADALAEVLARFRTAGITAEAAGVAGETLLAVVDRRDGADAVRVVEDAVATTPVRG